MMGSYEQELFESIVNCSTVTSIELVLSPECNLQCTYCYMKRHNKGKDSPVMSREVITQAILLFKTLTKRQKTFRIDLFGGEPLMQLDLVEFVLAVTKDDPLISNITIPTNAYFIDKYVEDLLENFPKLHLSLSIDGPIWDPKFRQPRDEYRHLKLDYDYLIGLYHRFKPRVGFHPMIYAEGVEDFLPTFKYFLTAINDRSPDFDEFLYLLPVRNPGTWTRDRIRTLIESLREWYAFIRENGYSYGEGRYNILTFPRVTRGATCAIQMQLTVIWDGDLYPCHRLIYPQYRYGNVFDYPNWEFNRFFPFYFYHRGNAVICRKCPIDDRSKCIGGCLGAQYEYYGDPFTPIPDICTLNRALVLNRNYILGMEDRYVEP